LIIRHPERFDSGTVEENVTLRDLYATLCDIAGIFVSGDSTVAASSHC
jgi:arylsulfatase A-like enzyme